MATASTEAAVKATGRTYEDWFDLLDDGGARELSHQQIAARLADEGVSGWWCQQITNAYEQHIGRRIPGQASDGTFQIGVRTSIAIEPEQLWAKLTTTLIGEWLPGVKRFPGAIGERSVLEDGSVVELRSIDPPTKLRLRWMEPDETLRSIVQVYLEANATGTSLGFHEERLPSAEAREERRTAWKAAAAAIASSCAS